MSGKLDQSLDTIMADSGVTKGGKRTRGRPSRRSAPRAAKPAAAPTGGVQKATRSAKASVKAPTAPAIQQRGEGKIMVSNLPEDIREADLKDFFNKALGGIKKVLMIYGPNGRSRGEATVTFNHVSKAAEAVKTFHGVRVDEKPMKVEIVGAPVEAAAAKSLAERMAKPKSAAKENTKKAAATKTGAAKATTNGATTNGQTAKGKKSGRAGRPKAKTAEELDAEMQDYFNPAGETNGAAPAVANGGDAAMNDEVL